MRPLSSEQPPNGFVEAVKDFRAEMDIIMVPSAIAEMAKMVSEICQKMREEKQANDVDNAAR